MKSQLQTLSFLSQYTPISDLDAEMITSFLEKRFNITPKTAIFTAQAANSTIDAQSFLQWFDNGYAPFEIVSYNNQLAILGKCTLSTVSVEGLLNDEIITPAQFQTDVQTISKVSLDDTRRFQIALLKNNLQCNENTLTLVDKYIPEQGEKIIFHNQNHSVNGLGIVRNIDPETYEVELYCYFIYPSKSCQRKIGYSMHELNIVNLYEYTFEPMMEEENRTSTLNGVSCLKRLNRELAKEQKTWKDKLHRIEPVHIEVKKGQNYWYISDKLKVVQDTEKGTPTSHFRYLAGNYFTNQSAAIHMLGKIQELIHNYLASPAWPVMN